MSFATLFRPLFSIFVCFLYEHTSITNGYLESATVYCGGSKKQILFSPRGVYL